MLQAGDVDHLPVADFGAQHPSQAASSEEEETANRVQAAPSRPELVDPVDEIHCHCGGGLCSASAPHVLALRNHSAGSSRVGVPGETNHSCQDARVTATCKRRRPSSLAGQADSTASGTMT
jgi:hypothetical protein